MMTQQRGAENKRADSTQSPGPALSGCMDVRQMFGCALCQQSYIELSNVVLTARLNRQRNWYPENRTNTENGKS
eukprot:2121908-Amphidinium_carterae.1